MIALVRFLLSLAGALLKPKLRLEAENAALRHQLLVLRRRVRGRPPADERRSLVLRSDVSLVSIEPGGPHDHPPRDARTMASGRISTLLALEVAPAGRAATNRDGAARADPAN